MKRSFLNLTLMLFVVVLFSACSPRRGCAPRFADLKTKYPHVIYKGPKEPTTVQIRNNPPPYWAPLNSISKMARGAILVSEDWAFFDHPGYDEKQIHEAIKESIAAGKLKRGASTITQQVVRNIYLSKNKSLTRKARELWMASKIEKVLGKNKILELYLNIAELGAGVFGVEHAAQFYFKKSASALSAKEGAFLAMLLPSPKRYAVSYEKKKLTPYARRVIRSILNKMVMARYLTPEDRDREWATPLSFESHFDVSIPKDESEELNSDDEESKLPQVDPELDAKESDDSQNSEESESDELNSKSE